MPPANVLGGVRAPEASEAEEIEGQLAEGVWSASMVGQGMRLPNIVR